MNAPNRAWNITFLCGINNDRNFHENQYARPFFLEFFICFLMHPPVSRVHIRDMRLRDFIDHDEMLQNIFNYDMRDCRFGYNLQCFELGAYPFGR